MTHPQQFKLFVIAGLTLTALSTSAVSATDDRYYLIDCRCSALKSCPYKPYTSEYEKCYFEIYNICAAGRPSWSGSPQN